MDTHTPPHGPSGTKLTDLPPDLLARIAREVHFAASRRGEPYTATQMDIGGGMIRGPGSRSAHSFMAACRSTWTCPVAVAVHVCATPRLSVSGCEGEWEGEGEGDGCLDLERDMGLLPPRAIVVALHLYVMYTHHDMTEGGAASLRVALARCRGRLAWVRHVDVTFPCCLAWVAAYLASSLPALRSVRLENCGVTCPRLPGRGSAAPASLPAVRVLEVHLGLGWDARRTREEILAMVRAVPDLDHLRLSVYSNSPGLLAVHRQDEAQGDAAGRVLHVDCSPLRGLPRLRSLTLGRRGHAPDPEAAETEPARERSLSVWMDLTPVFLHGVADVVGGCPRLTHLRLLTGEGGCVDLSDAEPEVPEFVSPCLTHLRVECLTRNIARCVQPPGAGTRLRLLPALRDAAYAYVQEGVVPAGGWRRASSGPAERGLA